RILDSLHLVLIVHAVYHYAVKGFGDALNLAVVIWCVFRVFLTGVFLWRSLYAYRVWIRMFYFSNHFQSVFLTFRFFRS
ncbi:hypothetical protein BT96DRAFT_844555, partial [Gymnopus androsaceus JB14]